MNILSKYTWNSCLHLLPEWWAEAQVWRGGRPPQPCNFKRGRERESGSYWHGHLHACISRKEGEGRQSLYVGGERRGESGGGMELTLSLAPPPPQCLFVVLMFFTQNIYVLKVSDLMDFQDCL